jgi:hypothetical protein
MLMPKAMRHLTSSDPTRSVMWVTTTMMMVRRLKRQRHRGS